MEEFFDFVLFIFILFISIRILFYGIKGMFSSMKDEDYTNIYKIIFSIVLIIAGTYFSYLTLLRGFERFCL